MPNIDVRKVQMVGYSTLSVSLPKDWVKRTGLKAGDAVSVLRQDDGTLKVVPGAVEEEKPVSRTLHVDASTAPRFILRSVVGLYALGVDAIVISNESGLTTQQVEEAKAAIERLNGFGVVEQTAKTITLQSLLDPSKFPIDGLLQRMRAITMYMVDLVCKALSEGKVEYCREVKLLETELDKIHWTTLRELLFAARRPDIARKIGIGDAYSITGSRMMIKLAEKVGDAVERMAEFARFFLTMEGGVPGWLLKHLAEKTAEVAGAYGGAFDAYLTRNLLAADGFIEASERHQGSVMPDIRRLLEGLRKEGGVASDVDFVSRLHGYVMSLWSLADMTQTLSEVAMNHSLVEETPLCSASL
ncbi:MAG: phosphate uptake regulator PhoU [Nitrososphaerota archaeon]|nr:phosphate uptake regulator PhoU [Nitrososphaerota archaeon]